MFRCVPKRSSLCQITCYEGAPYLGRHRHTTAQDGSRMNQESGEGDIGRSHRNLMPLPKTDVRYWQGVIFKQGDTERGQPRLQTTWSVRIQHAGNRDQFNLGTTNKAEAAARAKALYLFLQGHGWEATLAKYKGKPIAIKKRMSRSASLWPN